MVSFFASVEPAKAGFKIEVWYAYPGYPATKVITTTTDSQGKIAAGLSIGGATWPLEFHLVLPAGQTVDGVKYAGYTTEIQLLDEHELSYWYLYPAEIPPPPEECSVLFTVVNELGNPLEGASVSLNGLSGTTDNQGNLLFSGLALGTYGWSTSLADYVTQSGQAECVEAVTYGIQVTLNAVTPTPPPPPVESLLPAIGSALTGISLVALCL